LSQYLHDFWVPEKGFPGGSVSSIAQTPDGYLWIGTDKGLVRFDGLNFRRVEPASPAPFEIGAVRALLADAQGNLWVLLNSARLFRYRSGAFELSSGQAEDGITALTMGTSGEVLFSSVLLGPLAYDGKRFLATLPGARWPDPGDVTHGELPGDRSARLLHYGDGNMPDPLAAGATGSDVDPRERRNVPSAVISIAATADGKIWLGTQDRGLVYLRAGRLYALAKELSSTQTNCLLPLEKSELWIGTNKGLLHWNGARLTRTGVPSSLLTVEVLSMVRDRDSNLWVGTNRGLFRFNSTGSSSLITEVPTTSGPATALFEDREGNLWVGSPRGIERFRRSAFTYAGAGLRSESSGPVFVDPSGRTWFAPISGGLHWLRGDENGSVTGHGLDHDVAYSIAGGGEELWIGWQRGGLTRLRYTQGTTKVQRYTQADGLPQNSVFSVHRARDGAVWVGTLSSGVSKFDGRRFTTYTIANGLASNNITSILETRDNTVWFGTPNGLSSFSSGQWRTYRVRDGLPSDEVNCLFEDSLGDLWIGTSGGLAFLSSGRLQVPRNLPPVLSGQVFGIAEDKFGSFWIATADHVLRAQRRKTATGMLGTIDVREYGPEDGLVSTEGVNRSRSVVCDSSGRVWFSLSHGLSVFDSSRVIDASALTIPQIETVSADGSPISLQTAVLIPASPRRITFTYTGLSLANPERVRFRYFLEGFDRSWSDPVASREAVYTNLGAGSYHFRVVASNSEGLWNNSAAVVGFEVEPTLPQTWWFRTTCVALILLLVWCSHSFRLYQLTKEFNMRLEERVGERTRIARELHDTMLQSFHGLLMRLQAVSNELVESEPKEELDDVIDRAAQAITEGRGAVQGLRSSVLESNDLAAALGTLGKELAAADRHATEFTMQVEGAQRGLHPILRDEVYRVAGEALRNAFRHASARRIEVEIRYGERRFRLRVRDDGKGIDPSLLVGDGRPGHFGLRGMRERAKLVGGKLTVWSELESGTELELSIPAGHAYTAFRATRRRWRLVEKPAKTMR
jgi:signal transduction histidine kinase/ligand-binding sensor domain-containing protein